MSNIAVIDVKTTGLNPYRHDRIVEIAILIVSPSGEQVREFVTLVNPDRDIGPTRIHGLTSADVVQAPCFCEIAGMITETLDGCIALAGHNIRFDQSFLAAEFRRLGVELPECKCICTMQLAGGGNLQQCCADYGVKLEGRGHSARNDATAAMRLMNNLLYDAPEYKACVQQCQPVVWPSIAKQPTKTVTRENRRESYAEPPTYVKKLLARAIPNCPSDDEESATLAYMALLDRALEDRVIDETEGNTLLEVAERWSLSGERLRKTHREYLNRLAIVALNDGVISESERRDLQLVCRLLGFEPNSFDQVLKSAAQKIGEADSPSGCVGEPPVAEEFKGQKVCFTGECQCQLDGRIITRDLAGSLAKSKGLEIAESVTKKLDILVVADPFSQSGKAKKARQYGIRVIHEPVFWTAIGVKVT